MILFLRKSVLTSDAREYSNINLIRENILTSRWS